MKKNWIVSIIGLALMVLMLLVITGPREDKIIGQEEVSYEGLAYIETTDTGAEYVHTVRKGEEPALDFDMSETELLAKYIEYETYAPEGSPYNVSDEERMKIAQVIVYRMCHEPYPNSVKEVLIQPNQFLLYADLWNKTEITEKSLSIAQAALAAQNFEDAYEGFFYNQPMIVDVWFTESELATLESEGYFRDGDVEFIMTEYFVFWRRVQEIEKVDVEIPEGYSGYLVNDDEYLVRNYITNPEDLRTLHREGYVKVFFDGYMENPDSYIVSEFLEDGEYVYWKMYRLPAAEAEAQMKEL